MTRKRFLSDIAAAASEERIPNVISIGRGVDDGDVTFTFVHDSINPIEIGILALDVSEYPDGNTFMIFTQSDPVPNFVTEALKQITPTPYGLRVAELINNISQKLEKALSAGSQESPISLDDEDEDDELEDMAEEESDDDSGFPDDYEEGFLDEAIAFSNGNIASTSTIKLTPKAATQLNRRIRADIRAVRMLGFRIGILSGMRAESKSSMLSISIQATKLGLSEEAMQAWDIEPRQYLTLLIRYSEGYKPFEKVIEEAAENSGIDFRVGVSNGYKPSLAAAFSAFSDAKKDGAKSFNDDSSTSQRDPLSESTGFFNIFVSSSLNEFINTKMISILKLRNSKGFGWEEAKRCYDKQQGRPLEQLADLFSQKLHPHIDTKGKRHSSSILTDDHLLDKNGGSYSFPLLAAQFALMYLVRCTEFCLVCHDKIEGEFEALKPYVCDKPLCLYQYMSLGFGPSVEHEIQTQPYVVDLLISFCYGSARGSRIREYPTGMSLSVPPFITSTESDILLASYPGIHFDVKYDIEPHEVHFEAEMHRVSPVHKGDWVRIVVGPAPGEFLVQTFHLRVEDTSLYPTVKLSAPIVQKTQTTTYRAPAVGSTLAVTSTSNSMIAARLSIYNCNFDDMSPLAKCSTMTMLLETLPSIEELRKYIHLQSRTEQPNLRKWTDRISPAALGLLRWIIASNRSCLVQVDKCPGQDDGGLAVVKTRADQKVTEIGENWVQFRFAQGSPDKELRFLNALKQQQAKLDPKYPTMFAFHGSALQNWHSIIRHGLDFKETLNGRAHGHGVYHAQDQNVSCSYSSMHNIADGWSGSQLNASAVMSINEIINCPQEFVSSSPYIVVQHIDWIQCRYLLVQIKAEAFRASAAPSSSLEPSNLNSAVEIEQDPTFTAKAANGRPIGVPYCAASVSRAFRKGRAGDTSPFKKRKGLSSLVNGINFESEDEDIEDTNFLLTEDEEDVEILHFGSKKPEVPKTDFVPGSLDQTRLPILDSPAYATTSATMRLNRELQAILKVQKSTPLHELGWYIDENLVDNIYQWIVELHSFEATLPLAKDLKESGQTSVVIEIRFGKEYPHSPPFVRVVKPRFLPFMSGGGGHVTAGGALCMELLTNSGWSAVSSIESVLLQVRLALMSIEPKPARLEHRGKEQQGEYGTREAMEAFIRACKMHGWEVPKDFQDFAVAPGSSRLS